MQFEKTSVAKFEDIERLINAGQSDRKIAKSLCCLRTLAVSIRNKLVSQCQIAHAVSGTDKAPSLTVPTTSPRELKTGLPLFPCSQSKSPKSKIFSSLSFDQLKFVGRAAS